MRRAAAVIDLSAIAANLRTIQGLAGNATVMAVVKADAYGHGMAPVARAARRSGVEWLGVALPSEALALRANGDEGRVLAWLWSPGDPAIATCVREGIDLSVSSSWALAEVVEAARRVGARARIHVKVDTGLSRNGVAPDQLAVLLRGGARGHDRRPRRRRGHLVASRRRRHTRGVVGAASSSSATSTRWSRRSPSGSAPGCAT